MYDPYGIHFRPERTDIRLIEVEATEAAFQMGNAKGYNMLLLGALLKVCPIVTAETVLKGLKKTLPERHHHLLPMNQQAIERGAELVADVCK
jgi:2-oxoglutarate ferredoxin oxidoreductase subunit gamma